MGEHEVGTKGVLLDRDGTLVDVVRDEETGAITTAFHPSHLRLLPGVIAGLSRLSDAGYVFGVATNQPGPAKGHFSAEAVHRTNAALVAQLADHGIAIAAVEVCLHHPEGGPGGDLRLVGPCDCRKPRPGLLTALVQKLGLATASSWMVGDSRADLEAGTAAGLRTGLIFAPNRCELCPLRAGVGAGLMPLPTASGATLDELANRILTHDASHRSSGGASRGKRAAT